MAHHIQEEEEDEQQHHHQHQQQQQQQLVMDEMMEQILWNESSSGGSSSNRWECSGGLAGLEAMVALLNTTNCSSSVLDPEGSLLVDGSAGLISHQLKQQQQADILPGFHHVQKNTLKSNSCYEGSDSTWHQHQYVNLPSLDFGKQDELTDPQMLGKRLRDEQQLQATSLLESLPVISDHERGLFSTFGGAHSQTNTVTRAAGPKAGIQTVQEIQEPAATQQPAGSVVTVRPRVRARRGQATDPHSIAERLRRERIAERMKSLQELVPNSNKTDKASMLDEIIDYVKFLQLQVKVLSMSRLGSAGAVMADLPAEDSNRFLTALGQNGGAALQEGISLTERQVAKLMEEDMGSAMQYLQSKGLCLMPIHLASNMSSKSKPGTGAPSNTTTNASKSSTSVKNSEDKMKHH